MSEGAYWIKRRAQERQLALYRKEKARQLADSEWGWSCSHCGYHPRSTSGWCDAGCGDDYNRMTKVARPAIDTP